MSAEEESLVRASPDKLPGHTLALSMQKVWEVIREQKDLNLPAHKVCSQLELSRCTWSPPICRETAWYCCLASVHFW